MGGERASQFLDPSSNPPLSSPNRRISTPKTLKRRFSLLNTSLPSSSSPITRKRLNFNVLPNEYDTSHNEETSNTFISFSTPQIIPNFDSINPFGIETMTFTVNKSDGP